MDRKWALCGLLLTRFSLTRNKNKNNDLKKQPKDQTPSAPFARVQMGPDGLRRPEPKEHRGGGSVQSGREASLQLRHLDKEQKRGPCAWQGGCLLGNCIRMHWVLVTLPSPPAGYGNNFYPKAAALEPAEGCGGTPE